jgi:hypothetical protein
VAIEPPRDASQRRALLLLPMLLFIGHAAVFGSWVVDDAAISWTYARNVSLGHGLISQPGVAPVEGYSNLLWVILLVPFFMCGLFDPVATPKLLGLSCVAVGFFVYYRQAAKDESCGRIAGIVGLSLIALQSAVVIWTVSGLENGLYLMLALSLIVMMASLSRWRGVSSGLLAGGLSLTRPEGVVFAIAYPLLLLITCKGSPDRALRSWRDYGLGLAAVMGSALVFRLCYFGDPFPNTYYAKGGPTSETLKAIALLDPAILSKLGDLSLSTVGLSVGAWWLILGSAVIFSARRIVAQSRLLSSLTIMLSLSVVAYLALPYDWMSEYRFATPFFVTFYLTAVQVGATYLRGRSRPVIAAAICASLGLTALLTIPRSLAFAQSPVIPFAEVVETARRFERLADIAGIQRPSLLIADVGGALFASSLRIYDLGMLTDRTIARALGEAARTVDRPRFYRYVFEEAKPSFIAVRAYHSWLARLGEDPRFRRDYLPIVEYRDEWIFRRYGAVMSSGDFVRRDAIGMRGDALVKELKEAVRGTHYVGCANCE